MAPLGLAKKVASGVAWLSAAVLLGCAGAGLFLGYLHVARSHAAGRFASRWAARWPSYAAKEPLPETAHDAKLLRMRFPDGAWLAVAEHDVHDGGLEWDEAVFYDSRGRLSYTSHHFCGWEGLEADLLPVRSARTLDEAYVRAAPLGLAGAPR